MAEDHAVKKMGSEIPRLALLLIRGRMRRTVVAMRKIHVALHDASSAEKGLDVREELSHVSLAFEPRLMEARKQATYVKKFGVTAGSGHDDTTAAGQKKYGRRRV
jgi:hypothetical protein